MARANAYAGLVLTVFSGYFVYESLRLPFWSQVGPGAGAIPLVYGLVFGAFSVALTVRSLREARTGDAGTEESARWEGRPWAVLGGLVVAVLIVKTVGMLITILLYTAFHTVVVEEKPWRLAIPVSFVVTAMFYVVFAIWLGVPLPVGVLGI